MPASGTSTVAVPLTAEPPTGERVAVQLVAMGLAQREQQSYSCAKREFT
jgi:hypothetical protein